MFGSVVVYSLLIIMMSPLTIHYYDSKSLALSYFVVHADIVTFCHFDESHIKVCNVINQSSVVKLLQVMEIHSSFRTLSKLLYKDT